MKRKPDELRIVIHCDGSCSGNQFTRNIGGWGAVLKYGDKTKEICGGELDTTNQRMELTACTKALQQIKVSNVPIDVYSDSAYLINCMKEQWYQRWTLNAWQNHEGKPVANRDLWETLLGLLKKYEVSFHKVDSHSRDGLTRWAHQLARKGFPLAGQTPAHLP